MLKALSDRSFNECSQLAFSQCADFGCNVFAVFEHHQGRDAANAEFGRSDFIFVDIDFNDFQTALEFGGNVVQDWGDHSARAAPWCPEVQQYRYVGFQNVLFEAGIAGVDNQSLLMFVSF